PHSLGEAKKDAASLLGGSVFPSTIERLLCRLNGLVDVLRITGGAGGGHGFGSGGGGGGRLFSARVGGLSVRGHSVLAHDLLRVASYEALPINCLSRSPLRRCNHTLPSRRLPDGSLRRTCIVP